MTDQAFMRHALEVLQQELGPDGLARFLRLMRSGSGDYTRDREQWQKDLPLDVVSVANSSFDVGQFRQAMESDDRSPQVAYDEALLSADGEAVVKRQQGCADGIADGRVCFFLHYYDPTRPIQLIGEFTCPPPVPMPMRLARLLPYQPI